uniref:40S ribosomal protein S8 n=1 Tax=Ciona savignyi TaxID=51511 RepID=H2YCK7_CIOSA
MGISQDSWHKRRATGGKRPQPRKKRKFELGRPAANTKIGAKRIHTVRTRGGNTKFRGLRLDTGNFSWGSEACSRKSRIIDVMYNASNNELLRTKTLVKNAIIQIDSTPFRQWYEAHYTTPLGRKKSSKLTEAEEEFINRKRSKKTQKKYDERKKLPKVRKPLKSSSVKAASSLVSRPVQVNLADATVISWRAKSSNFTNVKSKQGKANKWPM